MPHCIPCWASKRTYMYTEVHCTSTSAIRDVWLCRHHQTQIHVHTDSCSHSPGLFPATTSPSGTVKTCAHCARPQCGFSVSRYLPLSCLVQMNSRNCHQHTAAQRRSLCVVCIELYRFICLCPSLHLLSTRGDARRPQVNQPL